MKILLALSLALLPVFTVYADTLVAFTPQGFTQGGPSPWEEEAAPNTITLHENLRLSPGLERGAGVTPGGTAEAWGGAGWDTTGKEDAEGADDYFLLTLEPQNGKSVSFSQISAIFFRGENSATTYLWQYQIGSGSFVDIGEPVTVSANNVKGIPQDAVDLGSIPALQNVTGPVTFRMLGWGASTKGSSWGFGKTDGSPVLTVEGTIH